METASDSRKRPLDSESESGISKKSLQRMDCTGTENIYLKVLVPSVAAGAIIGKGGETITQIQKDTGANIKMSKSNDYYPGTTERVCLITGSPEAVRTVHNFVMEKIRDKPDQGSRNESDGSRHQERHKQVKILVPNSTAGMIIGKAGNYISQIKEDSSAYVQISQKSKEMNLPERCVTVAGDLSQVKKAVEMILQKIIDDPQSGSCPNISYADYRGPVASANPTGSPYATSHQGPATSGPTPPHVSPFQNLGTGINNLTLSSNNSLFDSMKTALRNAGYAEVAVEEISNAMLTLLNYGFFGMAMQQLMTHVTTLQAGGVPPPLMAPNPGPHTTGTMPGIIGQGPNPAAAAAAAAAAATFPGNAPSAANATTGEGHSFFGPMGATTTSSMTSDTPADYVHDRSTYGGATSGGTVAQTRAPAAGGGGGDAMFIGQNQNSFGLGMSIPGNASGTEEEDKKEMEVGEHIVGAILGPGGRGIVDIQQQTCTNIQISKKGVYAPGTRNRIVTITGTASNVQQAQSIIEHRIGVEEEKRARTSR